MEILIKTIDEKGNLNSSKENACISLDKLSLSCQANHSLLRKLFEIQSSREHYSVNKEVSVATNLSLREKGYRYVADVYYQNEVYLQLAFSPIMDLIQHDQLKIKISNHVLYERNWVERIDSILKSLRLECHSATEVHIALDAPEIADKFLRLYYEPSFRLLRNGLFGKHDKEKKLTAKNGFHFNKRTSDLYITFYNKTAEYFEKPYVKAFHQNNNVQGNVHRIEVRAKKTSLLKVEKFKWQDLGNTDTLLQIFKSEFQSRIAFNDTGKCYHDKNRNKKYLRVHPFDFQSTVGSLMQNVKTKQAIGSMRSKKTAIKNLYLQTIKNPSSHNAFALLEMIEQSNQSEWFEAKRHYWGVFPPETVEVVLNLINERPILPENTKPSGWTNKLLSKLIILKFPEWKFESLANEDHHLNVA